MRLPRFIQKTRNVLTGMWLIPISMTLLGVALGEGLPRLDEYLSTTGQKLLGLGQFVYHFQTTPESATTLLSTAAGALSTIVAVAFSITTVTVQLASTQFSPRLLRNFMSDRQTQAVLGAFTGTVVYLLLVLRSVKSKAEAGPDGFVPYIALLVALLFTLGCLLLLPYFLHHLTRSIQATTVVTDVAKRTAAVIRRRELCPTPGATAWPPEEEGTVVETALTGYLQVVDEQRLSRCLPEWCRCARVEVSVGDFLLPGMALLTLWPDRTLDDKMESQLQDAFAVGRERVLDFDVRFGVRQLVDIALKALSPGINDVTTALMALNELGALGLELAHAGVAPQPGHRVRRHKQGPPLLLPVMGMETFLRDAFDEITVAAKDHPRVLARILEVLTQLSALPGRRELTQVLLDVGHKVHRFADKSDLDTDFRRELEERWGRLRAASLAPEDNPPRPPFIQ